MSDSVLSELTVVHVFPSELIVWILIVALGMPCEVSYAEVGGDQRREHRKDTWIG
ncbi:MAG TPA: hypothetical protein VEG44_01695 [Candidatus Acidoferrales bacterium]|nr:hypothetical protein [Candidatus Acidoferrales bacterium]